MARRQELTTARRAELTKAIGVTGSLSGLGPRSLSKAMMEVPLRETLLASVIGTLNHETVNAELRFSLAADIRKFGFSSFGTID
jgi:hypothetical protein